MWLAVVAMSALVSGCAWCGGEQGTGDLKSGPSGIETPVFKGVEEALRAGSRPLEGAQDLEVLVELGGKSRLVLLGEASHGTSEFYTWRGELTRRLVEEQGFSFIVVEGDWASALEVNRYVKHAPGAAGSGREALASFERWPQWMWANEETLELVEWLRDFNAERTPGERVGFFGMDIYGFWESMTRLRTQIEELEVAEAGVAADLLGCLEPFRPQGHAYVQAMRGGQPSCEGAVKELSEFVNRVFEGEDKGDFIARQDAAVIASAEAHFRLNLIGSGPSWNARAEHMHHTVQGLLEFHGPQSRGIVWAHNTHIGDARATMMNERGQVNIGMLSREAMDPEEVFAIGFGTHRGEVKAGRAWGGAREKMRVPEGMPESYEDYFHRLAMPALWIVFDETMREQAVLRERRGHRAIGVIYHPEREAPGNYVPTDLVGRYDAFIFIAETGALRPL